MGAGVERCGEIAAVQIRVPQGKRVGRQEEGATPPKKKNAEDAKS